MRAGTSSHVHPIRQERRRGRKRRGAILKVSDDNGVRNFSSGTVGRMGTCEGPRELGVADMRPETIRDESA
jgi:hypothetical protein